MRIFRCTSFCSIFAGERVSASTLSKVHQHNKKRINIIKSASTLSKAHLPGCMLLSYCYHIFKIVIFHQSQYQSGLLVHLWMSFYFHICPGLFGCEVVGRSYQRYILPGTTPDKKIHNWNYPLNSQFSSGQRCHYHPHPKGIVKKIGTCVQWTLSTYTHANTWGHNGWFL